MQPPKNDNNRNENMLFFSHGDFHLENNVPKDKPRKLCYYTVKCNLNGHKQALMNAATKKKKSWGIERYGQKR